MYYVYRHDVVVKTFFSLRKNKNTSKLSATADNVGDQKEEIHSAAVILKI
jgi:hypothetical protein